MRITFLGTAAAEGYPGIFCNCDFCREARALGGKNLRFRSALLVNDDLLIDFGPDLLAASQRLNLSLWGVRTGLVTHGHADHFYTGNFEMRGKAFTAEQPIPQLRLYSPADVAAVLAKEFPDLSKLHLETRPVKAFDSWQDGGYTFTALRAYHAIDRFEAFFYAIDDGQRAFLYATDTGLFPAETWQALEGCSFDQIVLEETLGDGVYSQHMGFETFLEHVRRMRAGGMLRPGGRVIAHHLSHSGNPTHARLEAFFAPHGVEVAYDGLVINL